MLNSDDTFHGMVLIVSVYIALAIFFSMIYSG